MVLPTGWERVGAAREDGEEKSGMEVKDREKEDLKGEKEVNLLSNPIVGRLTGPIISTGLLEHLAHAQFFG